MMNEAAQVAEKHAWIRRRLAELKTHSALERFLRESVREHWRVDANKPQERVSSLRDAERINLFRILFPKLAHAIEHAWQALALRPLDVMTGEHSAFPVPEFHEAVQEARDDWFSAIVHELAGREPDPQWLAVNAGTLPGRGKHADILSSILDMGGADAAAVYETLRQRVRGTHPTASYHDAALDALHGSSLPEAWSLVEEVLLGAGRQEGARDAIVLGSRTRSPDAFARIVKLIVSEQLYRFTSVVHAMRAWIWWDGDGPALRDARVLAQVMMECLNDPAERLRIARSHDPERALVALWCEGLFGAERAVALATPLLERPEPEMRWIAVHTLRHARTPSTVAPLVKAVGDDHIGVASHALWAVAQLAGWENYDTSERTLPSLVRQHAMASPGLLEQGRALLQRFPTKRVSAPLRLPMLDSYDTDAETVVVSLERVCPRARAEFMLTVLDHVPTPRLRQSVIGYLAGRCYDEKPHPLTTAIRAAIMHFLGDRGAEVRSVADRRLSKEPLLPDEVARREELTKYAWADVRTSSLKRLLQQPDADAFESVKRLLASRDRKQADAGADLLKALASAGRCKEQAEAFAAQPADNKQARRVAQRVSPAAKVMSAQPRHTRADALGLVKSFTPRPLHEPRALEPLRMTPASRACIESLDCLAAAHAGVVFKTFPENWCEPRDVTLGELTWVWDLSPERAELKLMSHPLTPLIDRWQAQRDASTRDADGLELVRAWINMEHVASSVWNGGHRLSRDIHTDAMGLKASLQYPVATQLLLLCAVWNQRKWIASTLLDQCEAALARRAHQPGVDGAILDEEHSTRAVPAWLWLYAARSDHACTDAWTDLDLSRRYEKLLRVAHSRWRRGELKRGKRPCTCSDAMEVDERMVLRLWDAGDISDDELLLRLTAVEHRLSDDEDDTDFLRPELSDRTDLFDYRRSSCVQHCSLLRLVSHVRLAAEGKGRVKDLPASPRLAELFERLRVRILEVELARGDAPTVATALAHAMLVSGGIDVVLPALAALGTRPLRRAVHYLDFIDVESKAASLSSLILHSHPSPADTPQAFAVAAKKLALSDERLVQLAVYQPAWASHVEHTLGWDGLEQAALWVRSHTRVARGEYEMEGDVEDDIRSAWMSRASEFTPVPLASLEAGAADRDWFARVHAMLGEKRWRAVYDAAKYACDGGGHTRAKLFADAILGEVSEQEVVKLITQKRRQDAARALGLLPLPKGGNARAKVLERYKVLHEMRRTSKKHGGSAFQVSERRAVEIGMENLARSAGYPDPLRLQWAMEIEELADLANAPQTVTASGVTVSLSIDDQGDPELSASKGGKTIKTIPPAVKKSHKVAELSQRLADLRKQGPRIRASLEEAMCRGDEFEGRQLAGLFDHPLLRVALSRLVLLGTSRAGVAFLGYPDKRGKALRDHAGELHPVGVSDTLRIAHPLDLLATRDWSRWQRECFGAERVQPFKQVFREI